MQVTVVREEGGSLARSDPKEMTISRRLMRSAYDEERDKIRREGEAEVKDLDNIGFRYSTFRRVFVRDLAPEAVQTQNSMAEKRKLEELHDLLPGTKIREGSVIYRGQQRILSKYFEEMVEKAGEPHSETGSEYSAQQN